MLETCFPLWHYPGMNLLPLDTIAHTESDHLWMKYMCFFFYRLASRKCIQHKHHMNKDLMNHRRANNGLFIILCKCLKWKQNHKILVVTYYIFILSLLPPEIPKEQSFYSWQCFAWYLIHERHPTNIFGRERMGKRREWGGRGKRTREWEGRKTGRHCSKTAFI